MKARHTSLGEVQWEPFALEPDQVISGDPDARVHWLFRSPAGQRPYSTGFWSAQPSVFWWTFLLHETAHILSGRVRVTEDDGSVLELTAGDVAHFPKGSRSRWEVTEAVTKVFVLGG